jgi:transcriptional regulator with XRE-family HTH domain
LHLDSTNLILSTVFQLFISYQADPKYVSALEKMGENIRMARKRRKLTTIQVAERADISRSTLYQIETGNPSVALGAYFNVMRVYGLQDDFLKLAADDELGRRLQDLELLK